MISPREAARLLGGEVVKGQISCPGPGHSAADRSLSVMFNADGKPIVYSHAGDDPIKCKDYVRGKLGMPAFKPNKGNGADRPKPQPRIIASYDYTDTGRDVS